MPDIASVLKEEIARLARKELRRETEPLKKAVASYRTEIAALKRRVAALEQQLSSAERRAARSAPVPPPGEADPARHRFSAARLRVQRERLGLSAADFAQLLGVSAQTIYDWEAETTRPRPQQVAAIAALRGIGKRELATRLAAVAGAADTTAG